jgi:4-diphosphocytidyl-2C-methyl-D-erythritol kinase
VVREAAAILAESRAAVVGLSGSGSAVFALYSTEGIRDAALARVGPQVRAITPRARAWAFGLIDHGIRLREPGGRRT